MSRRSHRRASSSTIAPVDAYPLESSTPFDSESLLSAHGTEPRVSPSPLGPESRGRRNSVKEGLGPLVAPGPEWDQTCLVELLSERRASVESAGLGLDGERGGRGRERCAPRSGDWNRSRCPWHTWP